MNIPKLKFVGMTYCTLHDREEKVFECSEGHRMKADYGEDGIECPDCKAEFERIKREHEQFSAEHGTY